MNLIELPQERWPELEVMRQTEELLPEAHALMLGVQDGVEVIGTISVQHVLEVGHLWVAKEHRGNGVPNLLAKGAWDAAPTGFQVSMITTNPFVERIAFEMGFKPFVGQLWKMRGK